MKKNNIEKLEIIIKTLRSEDGCPWDKELSIEKLGKLTIEETYELLDAIEKGEPKNIIDELADILTHLIFYFQIGESTNKFTKNEIIDHAIEKLVSRHPHVFDKDNQKNFDTAEEVEKNWKLLKKDKLETSENFDFIGPSGITAERIIKTLLDLGIKQEQTLKPQIEDPKELLFSIYFDLIQNGQSPEYELRKKLNEIRKSIRDLEKEQNVRFEELDKEKIIKILFQN